MMLATYQQLNEQQKQRFSDLSIAFFNADSDMFYQKDEKLLGEKLYQQFHITQADLPILGCMLNEIWQEENHLQEQQNDSKNQHDELDEFRSSPYWNQLLYPMNILFAFHGSFEVVTLIADYAKKYAEIDDIIFECSPLLAYANEQSLDFIQQELAQYYLLEESMYVQFLLSALSPLAEQHPEYREQCLDILLARFKHYEDNSKEFNAFLCNLLLELKAVEHIEFIRQAYQADVVDWAFCGDIEEVEIELGLRTERSTPRPNFMQHHLDERHIIDNQFNAINGTFVRTEPKIGRNDPCPCGSGKKYKKCCG